MTIAKNSIRYGALALALVAAVGGFSVISARAASNNPADPYAGAVYETIQTPSDNDMADYVKDLAMLTESEKQQLVEESIAAQPYYDRISDLNEQIDRITNKVLIDAENLFTKRGRIYVEHAPLWDKLWQNMNETQKKLDDYTAIIQASDVLTDSEKETLSKAQSRLDVIDAAIGGYYDRAAEQTAELTAIRDQAIAELQELYAKSAHLWARIYGE